MDRRAFIAIVGESLLVGPPAAEAQQAWKVYRIGFVGPAAERIYTDSLLGFRTGLREHGYVEGKDIVFEHRFAEDKYERLPGLIAELIRLKVDLKRCFRSLSHETSWRISASRVARREAEVTG